MTEYCRTTSRSGSRDRMPPVEGVEIVAGPPVRLLDHAEAERRLSRRIRVVQNGGGELLTSEEFARRAGARSRQSVHNWLRKGRIVGWEGAKRGLVFPAEQLDERGRPLNGLGGVVPLFEGRYSAWSWLRDRNDALDGARPIDPLRRNDVARVESAAPGVRAGRLWMTRGATSWYTPRASQQYASVPRISTRRVSDDLSRDRFARLRRR